MEAKKTNVGDQLIRGNGGYELVLAALLLGFLGWWLDGVFSLRPILMVCFGVVGFIGAGVSMYYRFRSTISRLQAETDELKAAANG